MQKKLPLILLALLFFLRPPDEVKAALICYDGANYAPRTQVQGLNRGYKWSASWTGNNNVETGGLTWPGLPSSCNRFTTDGADVGSFRMVPTNGLDHLVLLGKFGREGTVLWLSFLIRRDAHTPTQSYSGLSLFDGTTEELFVGITIDQPFYGMHIWDFGQAPNGVSLSGTTVANGQTALLVVKLTFGENLISDRVDLFVNPTPGILPTTPDASRSGADIHFDRIRFQTGYGATRASFDEIRIGEAYADVAPRAAELVLTGATYSNQLFSFSFPTEEGLPYAVEFKDDFVSSEWMQLSSFIGDGNPKVVQQITPSVAARFYRVRFDCP